MSEERYENVEVYIDEIFSENHKFIVLLCDEYMEDTDSVWACVRRTPTENGWYQIIIDSAFTNLPFQLRKQIIWHEIGHIECQQEYRFNGNADYLERRRVSAANGLILAEEVEADEYSIEGWPEEDVEELAEDLLDLKANILSWNEDVESTELTRRIDHMVQILETGYSDILGKIA